MLGPALTAVGAGEDFTTAGRRVHVPGLARVEGEGEQRAPRLDAHVHPAPARAAVLAAEQRTELAREIRAGGHPDRLRITRHFTDVTAVRLALGVQRLEPGARPVLAPVRAAEQARAAYGEEHPRPPPSDGHAVHLHRVVVDVLAVAHVLPVLTAVEAADDAADLDGAVQLAGVGGIGGQLQDALGRVGPGRDADLGEANGHRQLLPVRAAVLAPEDLAVLVTRVQHVRVAR